MLCESCISEEVHDIPVGQSTDKTNFCTFLLHICSTVIGHLIKIEITKCNGEISTIVETSATLITLRVSIGHEVTQTTVRPPYPAGLIRGELIQLPTHTEEFRTTFVQVFNILPFIITTRTFLSCQDKAGINLIQQCIRIQVTGLSWVDILHIQVLGARRESH